MADAVGTECDAGDQVAEHGADAEAARQRRRDGHCGQQQGDYRLTSRSASGTRFGVMTSLSQVGAVAST